MFYSHRRMPETAMTLVVRASQPEAFSKAAVAALRALDPNLAVTESGRSRAHWPKASPANGSARSSPGGSR